MTRWACLVLVAQAACNDTSKSDPPPSPPTATLQHVVTHKENGVDVLTVDRKPFYNLSSCVVVRYQR